VQQSNETQQKRGSNAKKMELRKYFFLLWRMQLMCQKDKPLISIKVSSGIGNGCNKL
jgi:hypothetical protein